MSYRIIHIPTDHTCACLPAGCSLHQIVQDEAVIECPPDKMEETIAALHALRPPDPEEYIFEMPDQVALGEWEPPVGSPANIHGRAARRDANRNRFRSRK